MSTSRRGRLLPVALAAAALWCQLLSHLGVFSRKTKGTLQAILLQRVSKARPGSSETPYRRVSTLIRRDMRARREAVGRARPKGASSAKAAKSARARQRRPTDVAEVPRRPRPSSRSRASTGSRSSRRWSRASRCSAKRRAPPGQESDEGGPRWTAPGLNHSPKPETAVRTRRAQCFCRDGCIMPAGLAAHPQPAAEERSGDQG